MINQRRDLIFCLLSVVMVGLYVFTADGGFPLDDSWIHQVYARNLGQNFEWAFVPGEPSAASTSPLYTVVLSIGYGLGVPYQLWTHLLGTLALTATAMLGARMADRAAPDLRGIGWFVGLALIGTWHLVWAAASGMETMLFAMFTLLLIDLTWREFEADVPAHALRRGAIFGAVAALAMTTRPEGLGLAGLCGLVMLLHVTERRDYLLRWVMGAAVGFAVFITPYLALNVGLAGSLLPNTADAKFVQHAPIRDNVPYLERLWTMLLPIIVGGQILLLPGALWFSWRRLRAAHPDYKALAYLLPLAWIIALLALYAARLPAPYQHGRYVMPALPALIVIGVIGTAYLVRMGRRSASGRVATRTLAIAAVVAFAYFAFAQGPRIYARDVQIIDEEMVANAHWIRDNLDDVYLLAIHDIGAVGYFAPREIVDIAGLVSPEAIERIGDADAQWAYIEAQGADYLMAFPDQVPGGDVNDPRLCLAHESDGTASLIAAGYKMTIYRIAWDGVCPS